MLAEFEKISYNDEGGFKVEYLNDKGGFLHFHPEFELVLNLKSYGTRIIGDSVELFDRYDMTLIAENIPHSWNHYNQKGLVPENHGIVCNFKLTSLGTDLLSQHEMKCVTELLKEAGRGIAFSVDDARKAEFPLTEMIQNRGIRKVISFFKLLEILCTSDKRRSLCSESYEPANDDRLNKRMTDVYTYIRENIQNPVSLKEISEIAHLKPSSLSRYFKKKYGSGFVEYVNQVRINKACYLLRETDYQVQKIATDCGFATISNFNKQFRKSISASPGDYREQFIARD
jgi:AraC-like DNA-binding protein